MAAQNSHIGPRHAGSNRSLHTRLPVAEAPKGPTPGRRVRFAGPRRVPSRCLHTAEYIIRFHPDSLLEGPKTWAYGSISQSRGEWRHAGVTLPSA